MTVPPPSQHHRHFTCHRHPTRPITGFCASCLRERLAGIDPDTHQETPITHLAAELRRCKSYSTTTNLNNVSSSSTASTATTSEPRRKSCDVRAKNTLSDLFYIDDTKRFTLNKNPGVSDLGLQLKEEEENGAEIRVSEMVNASNVDDFDKDGEFKTMKEFIDLELEKKRNANKYIAGSFWEVASVFRKKLVKWQVKQKKDKKKENKNGDAVNGGNLDNQKQNIKRLRDTQSEIGVYGFGRRSCDTDPRLSVDDVRYSFDEPRASWDGYLIGKPCPKLAPLVSVIEDVKLPTNGVHNHDSKNEEEEEEEEEEESISPGGTAQTRDYYSDRRRRRSFERLNSNRRLTLGDDEFKSLSNAKVSPKTVGLFHGAKLLVTEKELRDSNWYSQVDSTNGVHMDSVPADCTKKEFNFKKLQRWRKVWNIWGLMQKRSEGKSGDEESSNGGNVTVSQKLIRSYTMTACESNPIMASNGMEKKREELLLQRNRSVRYSPNSNNLDNGMLRFYLTPLRSYGRSKSGKSRLKNSQCIARNVL